MRSAVSSSAFHCSVYCASNITWRLLNIGPVMFQWKLWVFRYSVKLSERKRDRPSAIFLRSPLLIPISMAEELATPVAAVLAGDLDLALFCLATVFLPTLRFAGDNRRRRSQFEMVFGLQSDR